MRISDWSSDVCSSDLVLTDQRHDRLAVNLVGVIGERRCFRKSGGSVEQGNAALQNVVGPETAIFPSVLVPDVEGNRIGNPERQGAAKVGGDGLQRVDEIGRAHV